MREDSLRRLLADVRNGTVTPEDALAKLKTLPYEELGFAKVDRHRWLRQGAPEVIYGEGKTPEQIISIIDVLVRDHADAIVTRTTEDVFNKVKENYAKAEYRSDARMIVIRKRKKKVNRGVILVITAGTSDIPVAEEAAVTAEVLGNRVERLYDAGVAGVHRLLDKMKLLRSASVIIVVAGMEGALPSIVGGLVDRPVIAVPTSLGYGASFRGISALLGMLNSCASGVVVVNIDNGFGAGYSAHLMNRVRRGR